MLVDLETGCVVFKDGGDVVLKTKHLLFILITRLNSEAWDNNRLLPTAGTVLLDFQWLSSVTFKNVSVAKTLEDQDLSL